VLILRSRVPSSATLSVVFQPPFLSALGMPLRIMAAAAHLSLAAA
jgi:hypothetical protein